MVSHPVPGRLISALLTATLFGVLLSGSAIAATERWVVESDKSRVGFDAFHSFGNFSGASETPSGEVELDIEDLKKPIKGTLTAPVTSLRTGKAGRDKDLRRARHRLQKFLLRQGHRCPLRTKAWGVRYLAWVSRLNFAHAAQSVVHREYLAEVERLGERRTRLDRELELAIAQAPAAIQTVVRALQVLRGVACVTAVTAVTEVGQFGRFPRARQLMAYSGLVPRESSSGDTVWRGAITKTGNAHLRRVLIEAAWQYRHQPRAGATLRQRRKGQAPELCVIAEKAEHRLHLRYRRLLARGKSKGKVVTAIGRELLGFMWAVAVHAEGATLPAAA